MDEVVPSVSDTLVNSRDHFLGFAMGFGTVLVLDFLELSLSLCQCLLFLAKEARVLDLLPGGEIGKGGEANIDAHFFL